MIYCLIILAVLFTSIFRAFRSIGFSCRKGPLLMIRLLAVCPMELSFYIFSIIIECWNGVSLALTFYRWLTFLPFESACPLPICLAISESNSMNFILSLFINYRPKS